MGKGEELHMELEFDRDVIHCWEIAADGTRSVLFSTHITSDLEKCASHITFIQEGRLQRSDTLAGFMAHYADLGSTLEEIIVAAERRPYDADAII
jgi:ABC-2 type transport system ATP-binding protein